MSREPAFDSDAATTELLGRLRAGDPEGAEWLDRLYREALVRFCWGYLGRMDEAEDAAQEVCYKVLASRELPDHFRPWLYKVARNHCLNVLRDRAGRRGAGLPPASLMPDSLTGHLTRLVREELQSRVVELVAKLTEEQREVLRLRYVEELSRAEIAEVLELPESVVKSRLFEGVKKLREYSSLLE